MGSRARARFSVVGTSDGCYKTRRGGRALTIAVPPHIQRRPKSPILHFRMERKPVPVALRQLLETPAVPVQIETLFAFASLPPNVETPAFNKLVGVDPGLVITLMQIGGWAGHSPLGIPELVRTATPDVIATIVARQRELVRPNAARLTKRLWRNAIAVAHAARHFARRAGQVDPQLAYLLGLVHNFGLIVMANAAPEAIASILETAPNDSDGITEEAAQFGITHLALARSLAERWGLPGLIRDVAWLHHNPSLGLPASGRDRDAIEVVRGANEWVRRSEFSFRAVENGRILPWKAADELTAIVARGVNQCESILRMAGGSAAPEQNASALNRATLLATLAVAASTASNWETRLSERFAAVPAEATPGELTDMVAEAFVAATRAGAALCFVTAESTQVSATLWSDGPRRIDLVVQPDCDAARTIEQLLSKLGAPWNKLAYRQVPLNVHGTVAQVLCWCGPNDPWSDALARRTADRAARLVDRACRTAAILRQRESIATSLRELAGLADARLEEAKLSALAEMAAGAAHEINNPLAIVAGRAQMLLSDEADPQRRKSLETILAQAHRVHRMIADLMTFARPPEPKRQSISVSLLLDRAIAPLRSAADERQIQITVSLEPNLSSVSVDPALFSAAIECVIQNGVDAVDADGDIRVAAAPAGESHIEIRIQDNGPGIPEALRPHIFEPFYSGREAGRGLGLGLSKAWRIIREHGGTIDVQSSPNGTTVVIRMPAEPATAEQRACA